MDLLEIVYRNPSVGGSTFRDVRRSRTRKFDKLSNLTYAKTNYMAIKNMENVKDFVTGPHPETRRRSPEKLALGRKNLGSRVRRYRARQGLPFLPLAPPSSPGANGEASRLAVAGINESDHWNPRLNWSSSGLCLPCTADVGHTWRRTTELPWSEWKQPGALPWPET